MASRRDNDLGTPPKHSPDTVQLTIDGQPVSVPSGTSIMRAAASIDTRIPKLCATDRLEAFGSCRMCLVEIEGRKGTPASCTTPVEAGMAVHIEPFGDKGPHPEYKTQFLDTFLQISLFSKASRGNLLVVAL